VILATALLGARPAAATPTSVGPTELFFSEYIEASSFEKALEIFNGTGAAVDLGADTYVIQFYSNGSTSAGLTINLTGTVANSDVFVVAPTNAVNATIVAEANQTFGTSWFNGNDAVVLRKGGASGTIVDVIGQVGFDPGTQWGTGDASTQDNTLRRKCTIDAGDTNSGDAFDPATEWDGYPNNTFDGLGSHTYPCPVGDTAPAVSSTSPVDGATNVAADATVTVTFNEAVTITGTIPIVCGANPAENVTPTTSDNLTFTLPHADFPAGEVCTVTIDDAQVADNDTNDPPDNMAADYVFDFTIFTPACGTSATFIHDVQGNGTTSPLAGTSVTIEGIVVGDFQNVTALGDLNGFHVQEEDADADADPATSEGVFVYEGSGAPLATVATGDKVRVTGTVTEFASGSITLTEITGPTIEVCSTGNSLPAATVVSLPMPNPTHFERYEGMLVTFSQKLYATEHYTLGRFGEVVLSSGDRLRVPTDAVEPGAPALAYQGANYLNRIVLDDAFTTQNPDPIIHPAPGLTAANTLRGGDTVTGLTGIMDHGFGLYRIQPAAGVAFTGDNPRPAGAPSVGGSLTVAGMNLLNYFNTFTGCTAGDSGAPTSCRGAEDATEFGRQADKTVAAILAIDPDVLGVNEIENDGYAGGSAISDLVTRLNAAGPDTYSYIDVDSATGTVNALGTDAIKVGLIYKPDVVAPVGNTAALNTLAFVTGGDASPRNRASLLQAFQELSTGEIFLVNVNHFKSKGSPCDLPDQGDGQGNCNEVRVNAATELLNWLATDPTITSDPDILLIGDYNSYRKEDPIDTIQAGGYDNLVETLLGDDAYSYVFGGEWGYLDYAFASASMAAQVSGVAEYHINADEPIALDYNTNFKSAGQIVSLFASDEFRMSDHDPVIVGLDLADTIAPNTTILTNPPDPSTSADATFTFSSDDPTATFECRLDSSSFAACTSPKNYTGLAGGPHTFEVRAVDAALNVDPSPAQYSWTIDTTSPDTMIDSNPPDPSNSSSAAFTFSASEPGSTFECDLDGGGFAACTSPQTYTSLPDGPHTFQVRAVDAALNVDPTPASYTWTIDTTSPDTMIDSNPPDPSNSSSAAFTFSASEPGSTFECDLDNGGFAACTSPQTYTNLPDGPHTFQVRAIDAAGNVDPTPAQYTWTIDLPAPSAMVFVAAGNGTADNDVEPDVPFTKGDVVKWDGLAWTKYFDGSDNGVSASGDIIALDVDNPGAGSAYLTWRLGTKLPVLGKVQPQDVIYFDGTAFSRFFEGRDVGLTLVSERINGLEVLDGNLWPGPETCDAYLLISTMAGGTVRNGTDPFIRFTGEDVLGFCMTASGADTAGLWHVAFEGESNGLKKNSTLGLAASANAGTLYFTTKNTFPAGVNKILPFLQPSGPLGAPVFDTAAAGISSLVDSIDFAEPAGPGTCSAGDTLASTDC
jgi:hypothetical protein